MKKLLLSFFVLATVSVSCFAQKEKHSKWVSDKGYWMIESNIKTPKSSIIYFFNNDNVMIYQEKVQGMRIKTKKQRTLTRLRAALEQAVVAWEKGIKPGENDLLVTTAFKK